MNKVEYSELEVFLRSYFDDGTVLERAKSTIADLRASLRRYPVPSDVVLEDVRSHGAELISSHILVILSRIKGITLENADEIGSIGDIRSMLLEEPFEVFSGRGDNFNGFLESIENNYDYRLAATWPFWKSVSVLEDLIENWGAAVAEAQAEKLRAIQEAKLERQRAKAEAARAKQKAGRAG